MGKNIDEQWKEAAEKEKGSETSKEQRSRETLAANFNTLATSMAMEALIFLGEIPNPITKKKEANLNQAKYVIDTISLLKEKTKGNLTAEEANSLDNILYELQTKYIGKNK